MQTMGKHFVRLIEKLEKPKSLKTLTNIESRFIIVKKGHLKAGKAHPLLLTLKSSFKNRAMNFMSSLVRPFMNIIKKQMKKSQIFPVLKIQRKVLNSF